MNIEQRKKAEEALIEHWCESPEITELMKAYYSGSMEATSMASTVSVKMEYFRGLGDAELSDMLEDNGIDIPE